jgi:hypothetical protein
MRVCVDLLIFYEAAVVRTHLDKLRSSEIPRKFEPPKVLHRNGHYLIIDGTHRVYVQIEDGQREIEVRHEGEAVDEPHLKSVTEAEVQGRFGVSAKEALKIFSTDKEREAFTNTLIDNERSESDIEAMARFLRDADANDGLGSSSPLKGE